MLAITGGRTAFHILASLGHTTPGDSYALILFDPTGLAAPAIAAGFGALAPTLGTLVPFIGASGFAAMAAAAGSVAGSVVVAASFGGWYKCSLETLMLLSGALISSLYICPGQSNSQDLF